MATRVVALDLIARNRQSAAFAKVAASADATARRLNAAGAKMTAAGAKMTRGITLPVVAAGAASVKLAVDFQDSMQKIRGLVGISQKQIDQWSKQILDLAPKFAKSPKELADALYFITSSGISASKAMGVLKASAKAAAAGLGSTQTVADAITSAINAYGITNLSAAKATDILTAAVKAGKGEPEDLAKSIGRVISPAQQLGVSFDQVAAAMSAMTLVGLNANESATALRGVLLSLDKPTTQQAEALEHMHLSLARVRDIVARQGLLPALKLLAERSQGNVETTAALFGNVRALNGFLALTGKNAGTTAKVFSDLKNSTGATDKAFQAASHTAKFRLRSDLVSLEKAAIKLGTVLLPAAADVADFLGGIADKISSLPKPVKTIITDSAVALAALGPVIFLVGKLIKTLAALRLAYIVVAANARAATIAMSATAAPGLAVKLGVLAKTLGVLAAAFLVVKGTADAAANKIGPGGALARHTKDQTAAIKVMAKAFDVSTDVIRAGVTGTDADYQKLLATLRKGPDAGKVKNFSVILGDLHQALKGTAPAAQNLAGTIRGATAAAHASAGPINHLAGALHGSSGRAREFTAQTRNLNYQLVRLPHRKSIDMRVADHASARLRSLQNQVNRLHGKNIFIDVTQTVRTIGAPAFGGHLQLRQHGGSVFAGHGYLVGERRPEVFVPDENGRIEPRVPAGGQTVVNNFYLPGLYGGQEAVRPIVTALEAYYRGNYPSKGPTHR